MLPANSAGSAESDGAQARLNQSAGVAPPYMFSTPPPSIAPATTALPAPLKVKSLMIVCNSPLTVRVFP